MQPAMFLMAILGCGEGETQCQPVRTVDTRYESQAACMAATQATLMRMSDLNFPNLVAQCHAAGAGPAALNARDVEQPEGGTLPAGARSPLDPARSR